jgi:hypothetical protein
MPRRYLTRNQKEVAWRIFEGEVTMVTSASWAFFEPFLVFLNEVGFFEVIHIGGGKFYRKMNGCGTADHDLRGRGAMVGRTAGVCRRV